VSVVSAALAALTLLAPTAARDAQRPRVAAVPILIYHVIASATADAPFPGLYVPPAEFESQMDGLVDVGYHAVTLDEVRRAWRGEGALPVRPIVISFDNGYRTQYTRALPVLRRLGWVGDENLQLSGLPPAQGGLSSAQIRGLVSAGWELDTQGYRHADLVGLSPGRLRFEVAAARTTIRRRFHVRADWFCYPSGYYDPAVVAEVRAAGFVGASTVVAGWARAGEDPYRLPRLRVLAGTSPQDLLALIADARLAPPPPAAYPVRR
jgi:peptidoglycan/xylan/chitin deacetylase (PgdA/CDA1 family)